jgi:hypothetical protein
MWLGILLNCVFRTCSGVLWSSGGCQAWTSDTRNEALAGRRCRRHHHVRRRHRLGYVRGEVMKFAVLVATECVGRLIAALILLAGGIYIFAGMKKLFTGRPLWLLGAVASLSMLIGGVVWALWP